MVGWEEMMALDRVGGLDFFDLMFLPAVYNEMEMDEIGQHPWTILGFICHWPNCCCAGLLA